MIWPLLEDPYSVDARYFSGAIPSGLDLAKQDCTRATGPIHGLLGMQLSCSVPSEQSYDCCFLAIKSSCASFTSLYKLNSDDIGHGLLCPNEAGGTFE